MSSTPLVCFAIGITNPLRFETLSTYPGLLYICSSEGNRQRDVWEGDRKYRDRLNGRTKDSCEKDRTLLGLVTRALSNPIRHTHTHTHTLSLSYTHTQLTRNTLNLPVLRPFKVTALLRHAWPIIESPFRDKSAQVYPACRRMGPASHSGIRGYSTE